MQDPVEREEKKFLLTMILNWPNAKCEGNGLYRRLRGVFPLTFKICEDIKRKDHRNLSKSLQHYTAKAINRALLEAQARGIAAIPDVDAIVCQQRHRKVVSRLIGREVHALTNGVCCKVNGIRYAPESALRRSHRFKFIPTCVCALGSENENRFRRGVGNDKRGRFQGEVGPATTRGRWRGPPYRW